MGLFTPHIVLSTGLLSVLDENELEAVIYHEQSHVANKDPLKTFLLSTLASALWYIPFIKWSHKRFKVMREVLADQDAIVKNGTPAHIGSALLKMVKRDRVVFRVRTYHLLIRRLIIAFNIF